MSKVLKIATIVAAAAASAVSAAAAVLVLAPHAGELRAASAKAPFVAAYDTPATGRPGPAIPKSGDGHFWADGVVDGRSVRFLVDTGATAVALTPKDAQRLGIAPEDLHYGYRVVTAGGQIRAASVRLASITVAGARVENVDALVIEKGLDASLLGMTYLGRLSRFEATRDALVLQP